MGFLDALMGNASTANKEDVTWFMVRGTRLYHYLKDG